jgi:hypothetical protein
MHVENVWRWTRNNNTGQRTRGCNYPQSRILSNLQRLQIVQQPQLRGKMREVIALRQHESEKIAEALDTMRAPAN